MSPQEAEKIIREACIKANPSIMEIGFGCEINIRDIHFMGAKGITATQNPLMVLTVTSDPNVYLVLTKIGIEHFKWRDIDLYCEILGHPIRLSDVLLAIHKSKPNYYVSVGGDGNMGVSPFKGHCFWNLLNSLADQSDETKIFLAGLLQDK